MSLLEKIKNTFAKGGDPRQTLLDAMPGNAVCAEVGAWKGDFSERILKTTQPSKFYIIDPYAFHGEYENAWYGGSIGSQENMDAIYQSVLERFKDEIESGKVKLLRKPSDEGIRSLPENGLDWVYIDGNHTYDYVKSDLELSWPKIKSGGFLTGDDYALEGWWDDGVTRAVDEFIANNKPGIAEVEIFETQFIIRKK